MPTFGTITSQGVGSNLDLAGIVSKLMEIERLPLDRLNEKKTSFDARISALGSIKAKLSTFQSTLSDLKFGTAFLASNAQSSNAAIVKATGGSGAIAGNYSIEVSQLAQAQKLVAAGQADTTTAIGEGTITIDFGAISGGTFDDISGTYSGATFTSNGDGTVDIVIDSSNSSLAGIRNAINAANIGISASIVNDGDAANPYRLVLSSASGADQSLSITVAGDAALSNLLSHDPTGTQNLSETVTAQNALFTVDGLSITKSSNTVTDVIEGVTLELLGETSGTPVTINASQNTESVKESLQAFVDAYNELQSEIKKLTDSGYSGGEVGALASDSATQSILNQIRDQLNTPVTGVTGSFTTLSSIGISFQQDGTLSLDEATLTSALQTDRNSVAEVFSATEGYATRIDAVVADMLSVTGTIATRTEGYQDRVKSLEDQVFNMEARLERTEARLRARFTALDVLISSLSVTSNYLTQQLDILNAQTNE